MAVKVEIVGKDDQLQSDLIIVTSEGREISAQSKILASASPVLENIVKKARNGWNYKYTIRILGVSSDAIDVFLQLLDDDASRTAGHSTIEIDNGLEKYGMQILALSHAYRIGWLKKKCENAISTFLTPERVIDILKLAKLLDAPTLYQRCMQLIQKDFTSVQKSEGWVFVRRHDLVLELEILEFLEDVDERKQRWKKARDDQEQYRQLGESLNCLGYIFGTGRSTRQTRLLSLDSQKCEGLQPLLLHFIKCGKKYVARGRGGGCVHCTRMWRLRRLHADVYGDNLKVPIFLKKKMEGEEKFEKTWGLLVKYVARARAMSSLVRRTMPELDIV